jgi:hypothetical protein
LFIIYVSQITDRSRGVKLATSETTSKPACAVRH